MDGQDPQQQQGSQGGAQGGQPTPPPTQPDPQQQGGQTGTQGTGQDDQTAVTEPKRVVSDDEIGIGTVGDFSTSIKIPAHNLKFDEMYFLKLMSGSISLMKEEKIKIIESVPKLSQFQVDELIRILEEEKRKFAELDEKHQTKIQELQKKQDEDWKYLEMKKQEDAEKSKADEEAKRLREQISGGGDSKQAA
jgi:hypothetical protein